MKRPTILRRFLLWSLVAWVSAVPSFLVAMGQFDVAAMVLGVLLWTVLLTAITCTARFQRLHRRRGIRRTLYIGYGTRMALSLLIPVGFAIDMFPGMLSLGIVEGLLGLEAQTFIGTLLTTMIQGAVLNTIVFLFMLLVYGFLRMTRKGDIPEGHCQSCGYDLRASDTGVCPECGGSTRQCQSCGYDMRAAKTDVCPECGDATQADGVSAAA